MKAFDAAKDLIDSGEIFSRNDLVDLIREHQPGISPSNLNWTVREVLTRSGIRGMGRGIYQKSEKIEFRPEYTPFTSEVSKYLLSQFPQIVPVIWNTRILNNYAQHLLFNSYIIIEVDKYLIEPIFDKLMDRFKNVFIDPSEDILWRYAKSDETIVVKKLISQAPLLKFRDFRTISLEKLIVDLHSKDAALAPLTGHETLTIVQAIFQMHLIRFDRMMRYAGRRGLTDEIYQTLSEMPSKNSYPV